MFREPLAPSDLGERYDAYLEPLRAWCDDERVYTRYEHPLVLPKPDESLAEVVELVRRSPRGLLVAGRLPGPGARGRGSRSCRVAALAAAARRDLRTPAGLHSPRTIVPYHDILLSSEAFTQRHRIQTVLHLGGRLTSKRLLDASMPFGRKSTWWWTTTRAARTPSIGSRGDFRLPLAAFCETLGDLVTDADLTGDADWAAELAGSVRARGNGPSRRISRDMRT